MSAHKKEAALGGKVVRIPLLRKSTKLEPSRHNKRLLLALMKNRERRHEAVKELESARKELRRLVKRGRLYKDAMPMTDLAVAAGTSRERLYEILDGKPSNFAIKGER